MEQGRRGKGRPLEECSSVWGAGESSWPGEGKPAKLVVVMGGWRVVLGKFLHICYLSLNRLS